MSHRVLITGGSGYLGGSLLAAIPTADLPAYDKLYALVRTDEQAKAVQQYGAEPLSFNPQDEAAVRQGILDHDINVVFYLIDAFKSTGQVNFIKALGELKKTTGKEVHFLHTTGAKIFSSHAGARTDKPLFDNDPHLYDIHKAQKAPIPMMQTPIETNITITTLSATHSVHSYIFAPCIVYGRGTGFGNKISIQTVAIVRAARACRAVYAVDGASSSPTWPVSHVDDTTALYVALLRAILASSDGVGGGGGGSQGKKPPPPPSGKHGFYLASSGSVKWRDLYAAMGVALQKHGVVDDAQVREADEDARKEMAGGMGCPPELVGLHLGGSCTFTARNGGESLGWTSRFGAEHAVESAGTEVDLILGELK